MTESGPRVLVCGGGIVIVSGLERMTFETLRVLSERGADGRASLDRFSPARFASGWLNLIWQGGA